MAASAARQTFREAFTFARKDVANWFPGHMHRGLKQMQSKLKGVDCVIEVHDARVPISGRNPNFHHTITAARPHILVLNKMDLVDSKSRSNVVHTLQKEHGVQNILYTNCKSETGSGVNKVLQVMIDLVKSGNRYHRSDAPEMCLMVIGIPNVGKSSLINKLRSKYMKKGKAAKVGAIPGITRHVMERIQICEDPLIYLLDTPGVLMPNIINVEVGLRLALCATIHDHMVGVDIIADYLLFRLNKLGNFRYVEQLGIKEPSDNIHEVLLQIAINGNMTRLMRTDDGRTAQRPDFNAAASSMIRRFREGQFGKVMLDTDLLLVKDK